MILPFKLSESPASFNSSVLGTVYVDPATGFEYQVVKNTDAAVLSPGMVVTKESTDTTFEVDKATTRERIYGIVVNELTGTTVAVNDAFWVMKKGFAYGYYAGSGKTAIAALGPITATAGMVQGFAGTVGALSAAYLADKWNVQALTAKTTNTAAGTQVMLVIK
jgi:hypothetical protein